MIACRDVLAVWGLIKHWRILWCRHFRCSYGFIIFWMDFLGFHCCVYYWYQVSNKHFIDSFNLKYVIGIYRFGVHRIFTKLAFSITWLSTIWPRYMCFRVLDKKKNNQCFLSIHHYLTSLVLFYLRLETVECGDEPGEILQD